MRMCVMCVLSHPGRLTIRTPHLSHPTAAQDAALTLFGLAHMPQCSADAEALEIFIRDAHFSFLAVIAELVFPITQMNEVPGISLEGAVHACKSWAIERRLFVSENFPGPDCIGFSQEERLGLEVIAACPYGSSSKGRTARVTVRLHDGSLKDYFLRVSVVISLYSQCCGGVLDSNIQYPLLCSVPNHPPMWQFKQISIPSRSYTQQTQKQCRDRINGVKF